METIYLFLTFPIGLVLGIVVGTHYNLSRDVIEQEREQK